LSRTEAVRKTDRKGTTMTTPEDPSQPPEYGSPPPPPPPPPEYAAPPQYGAPPPAYGAPPQYGTPPPAYGGAQQQPYASVAYNGPPLAPWIYRVGGYLIDLLIILIPAIVLGLVTGSRVVYDIVAFVIGLVMGYLNGATGQTPGKRVIGIKVVREQDGQVIGGGMGILRLICHFLDSLACLIGWFWPLWDAKNQTFADKIMSTVVIKV
jgi:uncharacterized RDD family membrane protein YckC